MSATSIKDNLLQVERHRRCPIQIAGASRGILHGVPTPRIDMLASEGMRLLNCDVEARSARPPGRRL
jgi:hypothetical protein